MPQHNEVVNTNCLGTVLITHGVMQKYCFLIQRASRMIKRNRRALVLFVGSILGTMPSPYASTYGASKAFIHSLVSSLLREKYPSIKFAVLKPMYVKTRLSSALPPEHFALATPEQVVESTIRQLEKGQCCCAGYWRHGLIGAAVRNLWLAGKIGERMVKRWNRAAENRLNRYNAIKNTRKK